MPDKWELLRSLPFPVVIGALGFEPQTYKTRKQGSEWYGRCPVHQPKANHTSFSYNQNGKWNCFSCNAKGRGSLDLVIQVKDCGFEAAVAFLQELAAQPIPDTKKEPVEAPIASDGVLKPLVKDTWRQYQVKCDWLDIRVPDINIRERYGVFCYNNPARRSAYSGRVMIPVKDVEGTLFGYLGRYIPHTGPSQPSPVTPDTAKYLFPAKLPKSKFLFGAYELRQSHGQERLRIVYLVESPFCVMKFASLGLPAVSPFGWSVSDEQASLLTKLCRGVVALPDRNKYNEALQSYGHLAKNLWLRAPTLPNAISDPEQLDLSAILALTK